MPGSSRRRRWTRSTKASNAVRSDSRSCAQNGVYDVELSSLRQRTPKRNSSPAAGSNFIRASVTLISYSFTGPPPPPCTESFYTAPPTTQSGERGILSPGPTCTSCTDPPDSVPPPDLYRDGGEHRGRESVRAVQRRRTRYPHPTCTETGRDTVEGSLYGLYRGCGLGAPSRHVQDRRGGNRQSQPDWRYQTAVLETPSAQAVRGCQPRSRRAPEPSQTQCRCLSSFTLSRVSIWAVRVTFP